MKKILTAIIATLVFTASGQELLKREVDPFTGSTKVITDLYSMAEGVGKLYGYLARVNDTYAIYLFSSADLGCSGSSGNYVIFLFDDGTTLELDDDIAKIKCTKSSESIYIINPKDFIGKNVTAIRFCQSDAYDDCKYTGNYTIQQLIAVLK